MILFYRWKRAGLNFLGPQAERTENKSKINQNKEQKSNILTFIYTNFSISIENSEIFRGIRATRTTFDIN